VTPVQQTRRTKYSEQQSRGEDGFLSTKLKSRSPLSEFFSQVCSFDFGQSPVKQVAFPLPKYTENSSLQSLLIDSAVVFNPTKL